MKGDFQNIYKRRACWLDNVCAWFAVVIAGCAILFVAVMAGMAMVEMVRGL